MSSSSKERYDYIDLLEFVAILLVLFCHCTTYNFNFLDSPSASTYFRYFFRSIISASVPMFFFVNGFLLFNREFVLKKHIRKIIRLTIITCIWGLITILALMPIDHEMLTVKEILIKLWNWEMGWVNQFWFMGTLVCIYIIFPILKSAFDSNKQAFIFFTCVCAIMTFGNRLLCGVGTVAAHSLIGYPEQIRTNVFNMFNPFQGIYWFSFVYFCCGGLAYEMVPRIKANIRKANVISAAIILISMVLLTVWGIYLSRLSGNVWDITWGGFDTVLTFAMVIAIFVLGLNYKPKGHSGEIIVRTVSQNTLGIYVMHEIYVHLTANAVKSVSAAQNIFGNVVYSVGIMIMCLVTIWIIKQIPVVRKLLV